MLPSKRLSPDSRVSPPAGRRVLALTPERFGRAIRRRLARRGRPVLRFLHCRVARPVYCRLVGLADPWCVRRAGIPHVPPAFLRERVSRSPRLGSFLLLGRQCARNLEGALAGIGRPLPGFGDVLDFGCGCGRTLLCLGDRPGCRLYGTDIDAQAIAWCRVHLGFARFTVNAPLPPLDYPATSFDLVYALSVFTHLDEERQLRWQAELRRVLRPGGVLALSVLGRRAREDLPPEDRARIERAGFACLVTDERGGPFPEWNQNAYHTPAYVRDRCATGFRMRAYLPEGLNSRQDLVLREKP